MLPQNLKKPQGPLQLLGTHMRLKKPTLLVGFGVWRKDLKRPSQGLIALA